MKKFFLILVLVLTVPVTTFAQISKKKEAVMAMKAFEQKLLESKTDTKAVKLVEEANKAVKAQKSFLMAQERYEPRNPKKNRILKKDLIRTSESFKALSIKKNEAVKAKQQYLASKSENYKKALAIIKS